MSRITYHTKGVCSMQITFHIENGILLDVEFLNGCEGNLTGIQKLVEGMPVADVIRKLRGIDCDGKGTSCPDQLAIALEEAIKKTEEKVG
jgi:uncharacterized protein (TIGR03905 family)